MSDAAERDALLSRIAALEKTLERVRRDLTELRAEVAGRPATAAAPQEPIVDAIPDPAREPVIEAVAPVRSSPPREPPRPRPDLETLVGRYGMLALATLLALTAAGTFVGWVSIVVSRPRSRASCRARIGGAGQESKETFCGESGECHPAQGS